MQRSQLMIAIGFVLVVVALVVGSIVFVLLDSTKVPPSATLVSQQPTRRYMTDVPVVGIQPSTDSSVAASDAGSITQNSTVNPEVRTRVPLPTSTAPEAGTRILPTQRPLLTTVTSAPEIAVTDTPTSDSNVPSATLSATNTLSIGPITSSFFATPGTNDTTPLHFANVQGGQLMVVDASYTTAADGTVQLTVELLMKCGSKANCSPAPTSLTLVGNSGSTYGIKPDTNTSPEFGKDAYLSGQVWGYAKFVVPSTESGIRLTLTQTGQQYSFTLR